MDIFRIFGINFYSGSFEQIFTAINRKKGLLVVPAAPALVEIKNDEEYHRALIESDMAIFDSGFFCLLLKFLRGKKVIKMSGIEFVRTLINSDHILELDLFLVDPSPEDSVANNELLKSKGSNISANDHYVAPFYNRQDVSDQTLLELLNERQPGLVMINLGGGTQEKLGYYLRQHLNYRPVILCTGAAIAILTGRQAKVPPIVEKFYCAWLVRCLSNPKTFIPRYLKGFFLLPMVLGAKIEVQS